MDKQADGWADGVTGRYKGKSIGGQIDRDMN